MAITIPLQAGTPQQSDTGGIHVEDAFGNEQQPAGEDRCHLQGSDIRCCFDVSDVIHTI